MIDLARTQITGLILAGGAGRRVGYQDKGLVNWQGQPLIAHVCARLEPQVGSVLISCNRNAADYLSHCSTTVADIRSPNMGPLAGLEAAAAQIASNYVLVVPCDLPQLPLDLAARLMEPLLVERSQEQAEISYAHDGERGHFLCAALRRETLSSLTSFLDSGNRKVRDWLAMHRTSVVDFKDQRAAFRNFNAPEDFSALEQK